jgi:disulfide bond formation protein DsbB
MTFRTGAALGALVCALLLGYAYYLQYVQGLEPCPLCLVQRGFYYAVLGTLLVGSIHAPQRAGAAAYGGIAALFAAGGFASAARQVWLQHLPADKVPQCGPDLFFMLENFPLSRTLEKLFYGSGECAAVDWKFLGLSIAGWALAWFAALGAYALLLAWRSSRRAAAAASP